MIFSVLETKTNEKVDSSKPAETKILETKIQEVKPLEVRNLESKIQNSLSSSTTTLSGEVSPLVVSAGFSNILLNNLIKVEDNTDGIQCKEFEYQNTCGGILSYLKAFSGDCKLVKVCKKEIGKL